MSDETLDEVIWTSRAATAQKPDLIFLRSGIEKHNNMRTATYLPILLCLADNFTEQGRFRRW